jgi:tRNA (guanine-N7-)-methyltransferase
MTERFLIDPEDVALRTDVPVAEALRLDGRPLHVEVGFGKDVRLLRAAAAEPEARFVGIEISRKKVVSFRKKVARLGLRNVQAYLGDVRRFLAELPDACAASFTILFPDPWPKRRQKKHRWIQPPTAARIAAALVPGGLVRVATDSDDSMDQIRACLKGAGLELREERREIPEPDRTLFAERFERLGETVTHQVWSKDRN